MDAPTDGRTDGAGYDDDDDDDDASLRGSAQIAV